MQYPATCLADDIMW